jgi:hypothetical protein
MLFILKVLTPLLNICSMKKVLIFLFSLSWTIIGLGQTRTIIDSYDVGASLRAVYSGINTQLAQSFTNTTEDSLYSVKFRIKRVGTTTSGNVTCYIYAHSGTFGAAGSVPTGAALATSGAIDISTMSTSSAWIEFTFTGANKVKLSASTKYFAAIEYTGGDATHYLSVSYQATSPTHAGCRAEYTGSWSNTYGDTDLSFYVYSTTLITTSVKAVNGTAQSSIKAVNTVTNANIKKINGISNQ